MSPVSNDLQTRFTGEPLLDEPNQSIDTSLPASATEADGSQQPAVDCDTFEPGGASSSSLAASSKPIFAKTRQTFGPENKPIPPEEPRDRTIPTINLKGAEREQALAHNSRCWNEYAQSYRQYLSNCREAFANCRSIEELRSIVPEPPSNVMAQIGEEKLAKKLDREWRCAFSDKVDRAYELIGERSPGTLIATITGSGKILGVGGKVSVSADSKGHVDVGTKSTMSSPIYETSIDDKGELNARVGLKVPGAGFMTDFENKAEVVAGSLSVRGDLRGKLKVGYGGGYSRYDSQQATYGGGVSVGGSLKDGDFAYLELKAKAEVMLKGMSKADVQRVFDGWLAPE
jgi:hypothetical protein